MSRATIYANRGRTPRNCFTCDGVHACRCDKVTMRAAKRSAKGRWSMQAANDYEVHLEAVAEDALPDYCGDWCPCGANLENWMWWLRTCGVYPSLQLRVPVIARVG